MDVKTDGPTHRLTYLDQARAADWGHEWFVALTRTDRCTVCGDRWITASVGESCPVKRAMFALRQSIAEIDRLAKERCEYCEGNVPFDPVHPSYGIVHRYGKYGIETCRAQTEQLRKSELQAELEALLKQAAPEEAAVAGTISDGFGSTWSIVCPTCSKPSMQVVRPGKIQCANCHL